MIVYRCLFEVCFWTVQWVSFSMMVSTVGALLRVVFDGGQYSERVFGGFVDGQYSGCPLRSSF